jgi:hypothetical protein
LFGTLAVSGHQHHTPAPHINTASWLCKLCPPCNHHTTTVFTVPLRNLARQTSLVPSSRNCAISPVRHFLLVATKKSHAALTLRLLIGDCNFEKVSYLNAASQSRQLPSPGMSRDSWLTTPFQQPWPVICLHIIIIIYIRSQDVLYSRNDSQKLLQYSHLLT